MQWRPREEIPADRQLCAIYGNNGNGFGCAMIIVGIPYMADGDGFVDLFSTSEAGSIYGRQHITAWCPAEEIPEPPEEW
jgi:hypothetical protein